MKPASKKARKCRRCKEYTVEDKDRRICSTCSTKCSTCSIELTDENWDYTGRLLRKQYRCKVCVAKSVKASRGNKGFCQKSYDYKRHYDLSLEEVKDLQKNGCRICGTYNNLCVDHCHKTRKVRGCLCSKCNTALGMFDDSRERLKKAERYLRSFEKKQSKTSATMGP